MKSAIKWPKSFEPDVASVHVRNELYMDADSKNVWAWLIRAKNWPKWYSNSKNVKFGGSDDLDLQKDTVFSWWTFGIPLRSQVTEFVSQERIAWSANSFGITVYHAWLIEKKENGCYVTTEETQNGWLSILNKLFLPNRMFKKHKMWLENLNEKAKNGMPIN